MDEFSNSASSLLIPFQNVWSLQARYLPESKISVIIWKGSILHLLFKIDLAGAEMV
jgi:hypothetical protein